MSFLMVDLKNAREFHLRGLIVLFVQSSPPSFKMLECGIEPRLLIFQLVFDISGLFVECRLVLGHCRVEILRHFRSQAAAVGVAAGAAGGANC